MVLSITNKNNFVMPFYSIVRFAQRLKFKITPSHLKNENLRNTNESNEMY